MAERFNSARTRNPPLLHRNAVTAADKLAAVGALTLTNVTEAGSTLAATAYNLTASAGNRWGNSPPPATSAKTPSASQAINMAFTPIANAEWYDIFLSTDAAPLWVGRVTQAQFQAGGFIISTVGAVTAGGTAGANSIDLGVVGTGLGSNVNPYIANDAYTPQLVTPIGCDEFEVCHLLVQLAVTDLRSLPTLVLNIFLKNKQTGDMHLSSVQTVSVLTAVQTPLLWNYRVVVDGASGIAVLVDSISGNGAAATIYVEMC